ncbi:MAG: 2-oxoglutarate and iron-dependent oxygenase domain-containing protein [Actinomycetota bacterium]
MTAIDVVPVDLTPWFAGDADDRRRVARLVDEACSTSGFLSVTGHGIDEGLIERMLEVTTAYFDLPLEEKLRHVAEDRAANRGYAAQGTEALSYSIGEESPPDLFEAFNIGREVVPEGVDEAAAAAYMAPNVWPDRPEGFRETWLAYWDAVEQLGLELVDVFAVALGQPDGWFRPFVDRSISVMRANNYERRAGAPDPLEGQLRMGAHSDYGSLTILLADRVPGLQLRGEDGSWHDVVPAPGAFLVNLGDLLAEWTNDRWRATMHRVVPPPSSVDGPVRRRSIAWFQQPNHDAVIEVLESCTSETDPPRYPVTTSGDHLMAKLMGPRELRSSTAAEEFSHR